MNHVLSYATPIMMPARLVCERRGSYHYHINYGPGKKEADEGPLERVQVQFRRAQIEVDDPAHFWAGVIGGQVAAVEESTPLSDARLFELFEDAVGDLAFSETWLAGYLLGLSDALLSQRQSHPPAYAARLKSQARGRKSIRKQKG